MAPVFRPIYGRFHAKCISVHKSSMAIWNVFLKSAVLPQGDVGHSPFAWITYTQRAMLGDRLLALVAFGPSRLGCMPRADPSSTSQIRSMPNDGHSTAPFNSVLRDTEFLKSRSQNRPLQRGSAPPHPILYFISHLIRHILYPAHPILHGSIRHILYGIHGSSLVPSHLKLQDDFIGEQGLAALALGKFEELYEIEEEVIGERGARFARMGDICGTV